MNSQTDQLCFQTSHPLDEMEDEDMVHFEAKTTAAAPAQRTAKISENPGVSSSGASVKEKLKKPAANLGKTIRLTCRTLIYKKDGSRPTSTDKVLTMREHESLQVLRDKCLEANSLQATSTNVTLKFDGIALTLTKTPMSCKSVQNEPC
jgi:hypothetical protein